MLLRVSEAATYLRISRSTAYQLIGSGRIPVVRLGRSVRVLRAAFERLVANGEG
jgi:excisionase family DNA binding protein